jgi:NADPH-dependent curcumin reductase CurA
MAEITSREIRLATRPAGVPTREAFELAEVTLPEPQPGEIVVRNVWMSVDPYMRGRMRAVRSYVEPYEIGQPLAGGCVGRVIRSRHERFQTGDWVLADHGWREYWLSTGDGVHTIDPDLAPPQTYLGVMGMPGMTAYVGLHRIARISGGETVFVSAAAGAVGATACQIARLDGCRVVASAGSEAKLAWLREAAGVDVTINYRTERRLAATLQRACPDGLDVYFDNVGGGHLEAAIQNLRDHGRIAACGMISQYNERLPQAGPRNLLAVVVKRLTLQGFIVHDHADLQDTFRTEMAGWLRSGQVKWQETVVDGLENAPGAFLGLFEGENLGKMLVRVGPDD